MSILEARCRDARVRETEAELAEVATRCRASGDDTLHDKFEHLSRALARESHWLRAAPEATVALVRSRFRQAGWSANKRNEQLAVPSEGHLAGCARDRDLVQEGELGARRPHTE
jgi:hypothetical protein